MKEANAQILVDRKIGGGAKVTSVEFLQNAGGQANDSLRGFGSTEQYWNIHLQDGRKVVYGDNGAGIVSIS